MTDKMKVEGLLSELKKVVTIREEERWNFIIAELLTLYAEQKREIEALKEKNHTQFQEYGLLKIDRDYKATYLESAELLISQYEAQIATLKSENKEKETLLNRLTDINIEIDKERSGYRTQVEKMKCCGNCSHCLEKIDSEICLKDGKVVCSYNLCTDWELHDLTFEERFI